MKKIERDMTGNPHFEKLRAGLEERGYALRCLLQARSIDSGRDFKYPDVEIWQVLAMGGTSPASGTIVVRDMPWEQGDALGLWVEASSTEVAKNVEEIIGPPISERVKRIVEVGSGDQITDAMLQGSKLKDIAKLVGAELQE